MNIPDPVDMDKMLTSEGVTAAERLLRVSGSTFIAIRNGKILTSEKRGLRPLMDLIKGDVDVSGASVMDKVVGKAPALLYAMMGVSKVYAPVMSDGAKTVLGNAGIYTECEETVDRVMNDDKTGTCPMEEAVAETDDPATAYDLLSKKMNMLVKNAD